MPAARQVHRNSATCHHCSGSQRHRCPCSGYHDASDKTRVHMYVLLGSQVLNCLARRFRQTWRPRLHPCRRRQKLPRRKQQFHQDLCHCHVHGLPGPIWLPIHFHSSCFRIEKNNDSGVCPVLKRFHNHLNQVLSVRMYVCKHA